MMGWRPLAHECHAPPKKDQPSCIRGEDVERGGEERVVLVPTAMARHMVIPSSGRIPGI